MSETKPSLASSIFVTGLIAGTMDITAACIQAYARSSVTPDRVLKYIASAFLGKDAFQGGAGVMAMGLVMHYMIATGWATLFFLLYTKLSFLRGNRYLVGALYAVFVWTMMTRVLVPLTMVSQGPFSWSGAISNILILVFCIGIPISMRANRFYRP